jgi:hypothetical protein
MLFGDNLGINPQRRDHSARDVWDHKNPGVFMSLTPLAQAAEQALQAAVAEGSGLGLLILSLGAVGFLLWRRGGRQR